MAESEEDMYASELKVIVKESGFPQWKIAECMGVSEATIYRKLRGNAEISKEFERKIIVTIKEMLIAEGLQDKLHIFNNIISNVKQNHIKDIEQERLNMNKRFDMLIDEINNI